MKHCNITPDIFSLVDVPTQIRQDGILASARTNAGLIANATTLYIRKGDIVDDVTFGKEVLYSENALIEWAEARLKAGMADERGA